MATVAWSRYEEGQTLFGKTRYFRVAFDFCVAIGTHFAVCQFSEGMQEFKGVFRTMLSSSASPRA